MKRLIHFFSLAVLTQLTLMLGQLILLPMQVRLWGQADTAVWYSALALATVTYVVDCGLRTAGHAELIKAYGDHNEFSHEAATFRQIWSWIRILVVVVTASLVAVDAGLHLFRHLNYPLWRAVLICACALETLLTIRITYLDSLGKYRGAELSYLCFAVMRLCLSIPALILLHWRASGLAGVYLFAAAAVLFGQGHWLCRRIPYLRLDDNFPVLSLKTFSLARHTVAEPLANWARLSLPVLIIGQIAPPIAVTTYVALRAVFGAGRTTIQQLARVASVEVLSFKRRSGDVRAASLMTIFVFAAVFFGLTVGMFVIADNMRVLGLWLKHFDRNLFLTIALAFALTAPFFSYQIPMNLMFRAGSLAWVAQRHYRFILCSGLLAGVALWASSLRLYLGFLVFAELLLSISFFLPGREKTVLSDLQAGVSRLFTAAASSLLIGGCWAAVSHNVLGLFSETHALQMLSSYTVTLIAIGIFAAAVSLQHIEQFKLIPTIRKTSQPSPAVAE